MPKYKIFSGGSRGGGTLSGRHGSAEKMIKKGRKTAKN